MPYISHTQNMQSQPLVGNDDDYLEKEDSFGSNERQALRRTIKRLQSCLTIVCTVLSLVVLLTLWSWTTSSDPVSDVNNHKSFVPELPTTTVIFEENKLLAGPSSPEADHAWSKLLPPGDGFIIVDKPEQYGLPPGKPTDAGEVFDTSLFHELHCLVHIRTFLLTMKAAIGVNNTEDVYDTLLTRQEAHVWHCFDYIRQALMCAGDLTVEWPRVEKDGRRFAVDGWGVSHQCKDWGAIMDFVDENTVSKVWT